MKRELILLMSMLLSMAFLTACDSKDEFQPFSPPGMGGMGNSSGGGEGTVAGLTDFTISFDYTPLPNEQEGACEAKYNVASLGVLPEIRIMYAADGVTINGDVAALDTEIDTDGGKVTVSEGNVVSVSCKASANYVLSSGGKEVNGSFALKKNTMDNVVSLNNLCLTYDKV